MWVINLRISRFDRRSKGDFLSSAAKTTAATAAIDILIIFSGADAIQRWSISVAWNLGIYRPKINAKTPAAEGNIQRPDGI